MLIHTQAKLVFCSLAFPSDMIQASANTSARLPRHEPLLPRARFGDFSLPRFAQNVVQFGLLLQSMLWLLLLLWPECAVATRAREPSASAVHVLQESLLGAFAMGFFPERCKIGSSLGGDHPTKTWSFAICIPVLDKQTQVDSFVQAHLKGNSCVLLGPSAAERGVQSFPSHALLRCDSPVEGSAGCWIGRCTVVFGTQVLTLRNTGL